MLKIFNR